jgi:hypothetical protein
MTKSFKAAALSRKYLFTIRSIHITINTQAFTGGKAHNMFYKKIIALVFCVAIFTQGFAQTKPVDEPRKYEISAELEKKSLALLNDLAREAEQFYLPENRVRARMLIADLLWEYDEKQARAIFQNAVTDMTSMIGQMAAANYEESENVYIEQNRIRTLRSELLLALAALDPKFALDALQALGGKDAEGEDLFTDDKILELSLAEQIADKDPKQAYELAKKNLEGDLNQSVFSALAEIYKNDTEIGIKLAKDIVAKIKERKLTSPYDTPTNANISNAVRYNTPSYEATTVNVWQIQNFLDTVKMLNRYSAKENKTPVLSEIEIKGVIELLAQKYLNQPYLSSYEVAKSMPEITKYFPAVAQAIRRKLATANQPGVDLEAQMRTQSIADEISDKTVDEILALAEKKPIAERDEFYRQAAEKVLGEGDVVKAKELYGKVKKRPEYDYFGERLEAELPMALAKSGDLRATREMLAGIKSPEDRIEILTNLAVGVAAKGDKKAAAALVEEARSIYSGKMKKRKNLSSVLQIGFAYSTIEPPQSFSMIEGNLPFINDVIAAGILLDEFNELGSVESDEVRLDVVQGESYRNLKSGVAMIRNLANVDFERLLNMADRFQRSEARFFARFRIVEALLNADAEENEKEQQSKSDEPYYGDY